ncbi:ISLre2 family transposase [Neobacillus sp. OS1-32]|uniref:ISLre2 family transposase n=1 Tax=Neobacillus sp. OS1-32 TaxID=3070682 RepID=UPI0027DF89FF|nr:ISLre2 family transposase [Neobacillus sp. OS1-32]WML29228.1 ISLre2 family transposase [Neobacillus sp. OS1-32]WML29365.1 ISLre2 family transposase [Neobacillus sp. OS1-32]WML30765.1 ISLre2 family transposase [Neobacillus sp. OS1-32]
MQKNSTIYPNLKQIEQLVWRQLQETFSGVMKTLLEDMDQQIAEERNKKRYRLLDKRTTTLDSLFGEITIERNYYRDREKNEYVYLLDRYLEFEGAGTFSPLIEEAALELAITGPSYRKAAESLETLLGYRVISHEAIRQHLLQVASIPKERQPIHRSVLFVEVDGIYVKRQGKGKRGKEEKIAAVHQGWEINGKRVSLKDKRHFIHRGKQPFWEAFEDFLIENFEYDPTVHKLVINGDGASWITACREHFKDRAFFSIDRFHVARDIRSLFRNHPRYRQMQKALASYDSQKLLTELNSAVGTLETREQEERLDQLLRQLEKYPEALRDYREWLKEQGIETSGMRPMGSAEGTMRVFAKRLKNGRSWVEKGVSAMITGLVAFLDHLALRTLFGRVERWTETKEEKNPPRHYVEKVKSTIGEATRDNILYLKGKANIPVYKALKELAGF